MIERIILTLAFACCFPAGVIAQILQTTEAELAKVTCKAGATPAENLFASNGKLTPAFWGREPGDAIEWTV